MALISSVYTEARVLLSDTAASLFTDATLLPFVKMAYSDLQRKFQLYDVAVNKEITASINVPANTVILPSTPADLLYPILLEERQVGGVETDYKEMDENDWELDGIAQQPELQVWAWRENEIKLRGATLAREVRLKYVKTLADIIDGTTVVGIIDASDFLAARSAAIAAESVGQNTDKAGTINQAAMAILDDLIGIGVLKNQSQPRRRLPFRRRR
jgi:hypothetical protein